MRLSYRGPLGLTSEAPNGIGRQAVTGLFRPFPHGTRGGAGFGFAARSLHVSTAVGMLANKRLGANFPPVEVAWKPPPPPCLVWLGTYPYVCSGG